MTTTTQTSHPLATDRFFEPLKEYLIAITGLSYYRNRSGELADHVARHLGKLAINECQSYLQLLQSGSAGDQELDNLIEDLTIGETFFFRHTELFTALEQTILPDVIEKNKEHRRLRIWSAGSSIGAEAYTLSILLRRQLAHLIPGWDITIIGTDINRSFLSRAAQAQFEDWALRGTSEELKQHCFSYQGKSWALNSEFHEGVSFQYHNLAKHPFPSMLHNLFAFDVILCRNVMIYFSRDVIDNIVGGMQRCLVDGGWLLVGHAEHNQELFRDFRTITFDGAIAYQRVDGQNDTTVSLPQRPPVRATRSETPRPTLIPRSRTSTPPSQRLPPKEIARSIDEPRRELSNIRSLANSGEIERADVLCQQLLKTHKLNPTYHLYHALILEQLGQHASCEQALRRAIYLDRNFVLAHYYLGSTQQRLGRQGEAARSWQIARQLLATLAPNREIEDSDGLTVAELDEITRMQLENVKS